MCGVGDSTRAKGQLFQRLHLSFFPPLTHGTLHWTVVTLSTQWRAEGGEGFQNLGKDGLPHLILDYG